MAIPKNVLEKFWKNVEVSDKKRMDAQTPTQGVSEICDIPYIEDGTKAHLLDFYFPENNDKPLPLIIDIHGGGWMYGWKEINKYYNYYLASRGFVVMSINYRLSPEAKVYEQVADVFSALNWVDKNGAKYNCDMGNVFIAGDSAGGELAAITSALMERPDLRNVYGVERPSFDFNAAGYICGAFDIKMLTKFEITREYGKIVMGDDYKTSRFATLVNMSDILRCDTKMPPIWMVSSKEDMIGRLSDNFDKLLNEKGIFHVYKKWGKSSEHALPHVFCVTNPEYKESKETNDGMTAFFRRYMK